jgi:hypothetical protein
LPDREYPSRLGPQAQHNVTVAAFGLQNLEPFTSPGVKRVGDGSPPGWLVGPWCSLLRLSRAFSTD